MKKLEFRIDDISFLDSEQQYRIPSLKFAQAKFDEWYKQIENAKTVYKFGSLWSISKSNEDTHTARLIDIQEIKPKCEKHVAKFDRQQNTYFCDSCGCELIVEFKEKK